MTSAPSFRLLPVEPTEADYEAGWEAACDAGFELTPRAINAVVDLIWQRALSAAPVMAEATGWQPISSAPKDGRRVLLGNAVKVAYGYWGERQGVPQWLTVEPTQWISVEWATPTHWMPLPDPPALNAALAIAAGHPNQDHP